MTEAGGIADIAREYFLVKTIFGRYGGRDRGGIGYA